VHHRLDSAGLWVLLLDRLVDLDRARVLVLAQHPHRPRRVVVVRDHVQHAAQGMAIGDLQVVRVVVIRDIALLLLLALLNAAGRRALRAERAIEQPRRRLLVVGEVHRHRQPASRDIGHRLALPAAERSRRQRSSACT
jgi:hypothetical protein